MVGDGVRRGPVESEQDPKGRTQAVSLAERKHSPTGQSHSRRVKRQGKIQTDRQTGGCDKEKAILHSHITQAPCPVTAPHATERGTFTLSPDLTPTTCMALDR